MIILITVTDFLPLLIQGEDSHDVAWLLEQTMWTRIIAPFCTIFIFSLSTTLPQFGSLQTDKRLSKEDMKTITLVEPR